MEILVFKAIGTRVSYGRFNEQVIFLFLIEKTNTFPVKLGKKLDIKNSTNKEKEIQRNLRDSSK